MVSTIEIYNPVSESTYDIKGRTKEITVLDAIDSDVDSFQVICRGIELPHLYHILTIDDGTDVIDGIIINQNDKGNFSYYNGSAWIEEKVTTFTVATSKYYMSRRAVAEIFVLTDALAGLPSAILTFIIDKYMLSAKTGLPLITSNSIQTSPTAIISTQEGLAFPYFYFIDVVNRIMEHLIDWHWYVDRNNDFHFFNKYETISNTNIGNLNATYDDTLILRNSINVDYDGEEMANSIWIVGSEKAAPTTIDEFFTGDGESRYFKLSYTPNFTEVRLDGVLQSISLTENQDGTEDFLIDKFSNVLIIPSWVTTPYTSLSNGIKVTSNPSIQIIDKFENPTSIQQIDLFEKIIKDNDITDRLSARAIGKAEINKKSIVRRLISCSSYVKIDIGQAYNFGVVTEKWNLRGLFILTERTQVKRPGQDDFFNYTFKEVI